MAKNKLSMVKYEGKYGKTTLYDDQLTMYRSLMNMPPWEHTHAYQPPKGAFDPSAPCASCGQSILKMTDSRYFGGGKQFIHNNVTLNLTARKGEPMGYDLDIHRGSLVDMDDEEESFRPDHRGRQMAFQQFTALLQRARQDHNLLDQDEVWVNTHGLKVLLKDMSARYATNVLAYLRKNARQYHSSWATWEFIAKYTDQDAETFEELLEENVTDAKARTWLKETKLYKALGDIAKNSV